MSGEVIHIIEEDQEFSNLLQRVIVSCGYSDVVVTHEDKPSGNNDAVILVKTDLDLKKPYRFGALIHKIEQIRNAKDEQITIHIGSSVLDTISNIWTSQSGKIVQLTEKERDIMLCLYKSTSECVSRDVLLEEIWGYGENIDTHTLETHIYRLRKKIEDDASNPQILMTDKDGYRLVI